MCEKNYDVLVISESWLNSTTTDAEVEIAGYKITRLDRTKKIGGDHACGVHDKIQVVYEKLTPDGVRSEEPTKVAEEPMADDVLVNTCQTISRHSQSCFLKSEVFHWFD
ncbi:hypothetical protein pdam_00021546 [Pocillopora damicornis]|uniref:Uncharacterized protein n=1 Tax=Pocillopora damicornis TaxID=46731 RepID=A0A3M6V3E7_POCDA|nr:hypothetical protein pdam_00021546 [Pocillopora damicornis]